MRKGITSIVQPPNADFEADMRTAESVYDVLDKADQLILRAQGSIVELLGIEEMLMARPDCFSSQAHLITKAAISKVRVQALKEPTHIEMIVPMYHENIRMAPRQNSLRKLLANPLEPHQHGEDSLLRKHIELEWLTTGSRVTYRLIFVDDMCDRNSGSIAQEIIDANGLESCKVLHLEDAINNSIPNSLEHRAVETIITRGESIRGGALCLGFAHAVTHIKENGLENNSVVGYVDADSSYSLTQLGIPLSQIKSSPSIVAATASRQHHLTYMEPKKSESQTSQRSPGLIRIKQVVGYLRKFVLGKEVPADTQSGFKLIKPDVLEKTLLQPGKAHNFSYDTQLLARISKMDPQVGISPFGVVCLDCDELSTANNGVTYYYALQIINTIAEEFNFSADTNEMWLLDFLTKDINNYYLAKSVLEDSSDISQWFNQNSKEFQLAVEVRNKIITERDTTAVGTYFTPDICQKLCEIFKKIQHLR